MKKNITLFILTLVLIPIFVISIIYKSLEEEIKENTDLKPKITSVTNTTTKEYKEVEKEIKVKIKKNNKIEELNLEDYIVGVVAGEMPASFEKEALKAQAIASRTYALYQKEISNNVLEITTDDQVYNTIDEMKEKWSEDYEKYYKKIKNAVTETKYMIMKKNNKLFKSFYFAMSNGYTEDEVAVFSTNNLESVSSPWDNETLNKFKVSTTFRKEDLEKLLNIKNIENITILDRDKTNRVKNIKINSITLTGIEFRKLLNLRSTDFEISTENNNYIITTKGYGHGVGMSQYGANGMAKENYKYDEILKYYYSDIEIEKIIV